MFLLFQTITWRREAVQRLEKWAILKRPLVDSPSDPSKQQSKLSTNDLPTDFKTPVFNRQDITPHAASTSLQQPLQAEPEQVTPNIVQMHLLEERHSYAKRPVRAITEGVRRMSAARRALTSSYPLEDERFILEIGKCTSIEQVAEKVLSVSSCRTLVEEKILQSMDDDLQVLCSEGANGSVLSAKVSDERLKDVMELAITEMDKRAPFLFRVLVKGAGSSSGKEWFLAAIYGMLMRQRSQRMNAVQRLMTAACLRYHAGNQVCILGCVLVSSSNICTQTTVFCLHFIATEVDNQVTILNIDAQYFLKVQTSEQ